MIIGYTQGTYDMFHIGHLNILRNAKTQCDYLIVGVNSDELVLEYKKKQVIVPCEERVDIISSIKYVDKVVICNTLDKTNAFNQFNFNKLFIGDDWQGTARWIETEKSLNRLGVNVVYLPHTNSTSSTLLRTKLNDYY